jgi:hypothetical protein
MRKTSARGAAESAKLCYLEATQISGPIKDFEDVQVRHREHGTIGRLDGIVIDPAEQRVRYLVVDNERFLGRRYLMPLDAAQLDVEHHALWVDCDDAAFTIYEEFDREDFRRFSFRPRS